MSAVLIGNFYRATLNPKNIEIQPDTGAYDYTRLPEKTVLAIHRVRNILKMALERLACFSTQSQELQDPYRYRQMFTIGGPNKEALQQELVLMIFDETLLKNQKPTWNEILATEPSQAVVEAYQEACAQLYAKTSAEA